MRLAPDKIQHIKGGVGVALVAALDVWVALKFGPGFAVALAGVVIGVGLEAYQKIRREGTPDPWDALATALPCLVTGLAYETLRHV